MELTLRNRSINFRFGASLSAIIIIGALLPFAAASGRWFWLDELMTVNFSSAGPWPTLVNVLRFDVHPPLYYLQLSIWMLVSRSDGWLMANSVFWHAAAIALLTLGAARFHGTKVGLAAGLLFAVSPAALAYADQVRMYSFCTFLLLWVWYTQTGFVDKTAGRYGSLWMILSQVALTNSHTAGLFMLSGCVIFGGARVLFSGERQLFAHWLRIEIAAGVLSLFPVLVGMTRGVLHLTVPTFHDLLTTWIWLTGGALLPFLAGLALGIGVLGFPAIVSFYDRPLALELSALVCAPLLLVMAYSYIAQPIWINYIFVPVTPFICLTWARAALDGGPRRLGLAPLVGLVAIWGTVCVSAQLAGATGDAYNKRGDAYKVVADLIHQRVRPGDLILVNDHISYWCFMWYFDGSQWGQPRHAFIDDGDWRRLMHRLPSFVPVILGLNETDAMRQVGGITTELWISRSAVPSTKGRIFLLRQVAAAPSVPLRGRHVDETTIVKPLVIERWVSDATRQGATAQPSKLLR